MIRVFLIGRTYLTHASIRLISKKYEVEFIDDLDVSLSLGVIPDYFVIGPGPHKINLMKLKRLNVKRLTLEEYFKLISPMKRLKTAKP